MSISRYRRTKKQKNNNILYKEMFEKRDINYINHYKTPKFNWDLENVQFQTIEHIWNTGDRLYKLAEHYYGDPTLWWIISFVNQKPTEHDYREGDIILIPNPPGKVLEFMGV